VSSGTWALLWVADVEVLEQTLASISNDTLLKASFGGINIEKIPAKCKWMFRLLFCIY
jgi:hypothetical protein